MCGVLVYTVARTRAPWLPPTIEGERATSLMLVCACTRQQQVIVDKAAAKPSMHTTVCVCARACVRACVRACDELSVSEGP